MTFGKFAARRRRIRISTRREISRALRCERLEERRLLDASAPAILQIFESTYDNTEERTADLFQAGFGAVWIPPTGRADSGNQSVGYDAYNRFDLGAPDGPTLYGTETGLKTVVDVLHDANFNVYADFIANHNGFRDLGTPGFADEGAYPGFALSLNPGNNVHGIDDIDGDFHSGFDSGDLNGRLAGLIDIAQEKNYQFIRNPTDPADPLNIPAGTLTNQANPDNARFYPDQSLPPIMLFDPLTGESDLAVHPFNTTDPLQGDPVTENSLGLIMRNAQWLIQEVGVDGLRLDAAKHFPQFVMGFLDRAVYRAIQEPLLDGSQEHAFLFSEIFSSDKGEIQSLIRKDIDPGDPGRIGGNRDALDFPLFFAMRDNLTGNGFTNDWRNIKNASQDSQDDGLANNGSQGVAFVNSHDEEGAHLSNVAHAYVLLRPGNAIVYFNAEEFGQGRDFPKDGRGDALGGQFGDTITKLVNIRNTHGRGDYIDRTPGADEKEMLIFERSASALAVLSNRVDPGFDSRTIQTNFLSGTPLIDLTGNSANSTIDPFNDFPEVLVVNGDGTVNLNVPRNQAPSGTQHETGYFIYGPSGPQGSLSLTNVASTLGPGTATPTTNGTTRVTSIDVVTADNFEVQLDTVAVNHLGSIRDQFADGDNALLKLDAGIDVNGNGSVDFVGQGGPSTGFEEFLTFKQPGFFETSGNGLYRQTVDTTTLDEGMHFLEVRAFRHREPGEGDAIYTPFKRSIYVDRLKPVSALESFDPIVQGVNENRELRIRSTDLTGDNVHVFLDLPASLTDAQVIGMLDSNSQTNQLDRDLWQQDVTGVTHGNHVATMVTFEISGNVNVQRVPGLFTSTIFGAGLGDLDFDGDVDVTDMDLFETVYQSLNSDFNPAADMNGDGLVDINDLPLLYELLVDSGNTGPTFDRFDEVVIDNAPVDYGDATQRYTTFQFSGGPHHILTVGPTLGPSADADADGQPTVNADGDDLAGDDEDGLISLTPMIPGTVATMTIEASSDALLDAWIDFDGDGVFDHPAEHLNAGTSISVVSGSNAIAVSVPIDAATGTTFARLRLSTHGNLSPFSLAGNGEVEDHRVAVRSTTVSIDGVNNLLIQDTHGADTDDNITIRVDGANIRVSDPGGTLLAGNGATPEGDDVLVPLAGITGPTGIIVDLLGGDDSLTVDFDGGDFPVEIDYRGGETLEVFGDALTLTGGGTFALATYNFNNIVGGDLDHGTIELSGNATITYGGLEPIHSEITATDVTLNYSDAAETITVSKAAGLVWTENFSNNSLYTAGFNGANPQVLVDAANIPFSTVGSATINLRDVVSRGSFIYWADTSQESIYRSNLDGTNPEVLIDGADIPLSSISSDARRGPVNVTTDDDFIYWSDFLQNSMYRANLDGTNPEVLVDEADLPVSSAGAAISFDPAGTAVNDSFIYWADNRQDSIYRANLDGTNPLVLVDKANIPISSVGSPTNLFKRDLVVDDNFVYWADIRQDSIYRANIDGSSPQVLIDAADIPFAANGRIGDINPIGITIDDGVLYWADDAQDSIYRALIDGTKPQVFVDAINIPLSSVGDPIFVGPSHVTVAQRPGLTRVTSTAGETITLNNLTGTLTINSGDGADTVTVAGVGDGFAGNLAIDGQGDTDAINLNGGITFSADRSLSVTGDTITVASDQTFATSGNGTIDLIADRMILDATANVTAATSSVTVRPLTIATAVDLGAVSDPIGGPLSLSDSELGTITAGEFRVGDVNTGAITVSVPITVASNVHLTTSPTTGLIPQTIGADLDLGGGDLSIATGSDLNIGIDGATVDTQYDQLNVSGGVDLTGVDLVLSGSYAPIEGDILTIVSATNVSGTFASLPEDAVVEFNGNLLRINYSATTVTLSFVTADSLDLGDAPDPFPTLLSDNGARHLSVGPRLGDSRDGELDGQPTAGADGDDANGDDEDGVLFGNIKVGHTMAGINIDLQNAATARVDAWVDFDGNGTWDADEKILDNEQVIAGLQTINYPIAVDAVAGDTYARVRISTDGSLDQTGLADDGEVEDYLVTIIPAGTPIIESIVVNGGAEHRNTLTEVVVTFDREVTAPDSAFAIKDRSDDTVLDSLIVNSSAIGGKTVSVLTFGHPGNLVAERQNGIHSLIDGNFQLDLSPSLITPLGGGPNLAGDVSFGDQEIDAFFRYLGDDDGDRDADVADLGQFGLTFRSNSTQPNFNPDFDFDGDLDVDVTDLGQFGQRFRGRLDF